MIYITETYDKERGIYSIKNVWDVPTREAKELYHDFVGKRAESKGFIINTHYLNLMGKEHHYKMSDEEYQEAQRVWHKFLRQWSFDRFVHEKLGGVKLKFKII